MSEPGILGGVPADRWTINQAAELVGRSRSVLRRYIYSKVFIPSETLRAGKLDVYLYTPEDIEDLRAFLTDQHRGHPKYGQLRALRRVKVLDLDVGDIIADPRGSAQTFAIVIDNRDDDAAPDARALLLVERTTDPRMQFSTSIQRDRRLMTFVPRC